MIEIVKLFYRIALLKKSPQDVPSSLTLKYLVIFCYTAIGFLMLSISESGIKAVSQVAVEIVLAWFFCKGVLYWAGKSSRFQQTFIALMGTDTLISFFAFPVISALATPMPESSSIPFIAVLILIFLILWNWVITGYILHHALSQPLLFGLGVALLYLMLSHQLIGFLFPEIVILE